MMRNDPLAHIERVHTMRLGAIDLARVAEYDPENYR